MGQVVYQTGFVQPQQVPSIALASAASITTAKALGLAIANIPDNTIGQVRISDNFSPIDTSTFILYAKVFLSNTPGDISNAPGTISVTIGQVVVVDLAGCIRIMCKLINNDCGGGTEGPQGVTGLQGEGVTGLQGATGIGSGGGGGGTGSSNTLNMNALGNLTFAGLLPATNVGPELTGGPTTYIDFRARRGSAGSAGTTTIQLELNGAAIVGAILNWTSADPNFTLKSVVIALPVIAGDRLSFRITSRESGTPRDIYAEVNA
jgi:hypothetical protein